MGGGGGAETVLEPARGGWEGAFYLPQLLAHTLLPPGHVRLMPRPSLPEFPEPPSVSLSVLSLDGAYTVLQGDGPDPSLSPTPCVQPTASTAEEQAAGPRPALASLLSGQQLPWVEGPGMLLSTSCFPHVAAVPQQASRDTSMGEERGVIGRKSTVASICPPCAVCVSLGQMGGR